LGNNIPPVSPSKGGTTEFPPGTPRGIEGDVKLLPSSKSDELFKKLAISTPVARTKQSRVSVAIFCSLLPVNTVILR